MPKVHVEVNTFDTDDTIANVKLRCGSYCNVTVETVDLNGNNVVKRGSINTLGTWQAHALHICMMYNIILVC